jgi:hypothetical protein
VSPRCRSRGIGSSLLSTAEAWLAQPGIAVVSAGADTCHLLPGVPVLDRGNYDKLMSFFSVRGWREGGFEYDLCADLATLDFDFLRQGVVFDDR